MILEQLVNALTLGSIYVLVALGFTLVFGVLNIINMAHGAIFMIGGFSGMILSSWFGLPFVLALLGAMIISGMLGLVLEYVALRPMRKSQQSSALPSLISTIGLAIVLENLAHRFFGSGNQPFRAALPDIHIPIGTANIDTVQIIIIVIAIGTTIALQKWLTKGKNGKALRAVANNHEAASLLGINVQLVIITTVVIASMLGGLAGTLVGVALNTVNPQMGLSMGLKGLAIIIVGGMGNVRGAVVGGLLLGFIETIVVVLGYSGYIDAIAFAMIIIILLTRPQGLFGNPSLS